MSEIRQTPDIGKLTSQRGRDAIHVAVAPVVAAESLEPGQHVGLLPDGEASGGVTPIIGIVDPYLRETVWEGDRFWLFLYPNTITSLRHEWMHPAFPPQQAESVAWLTRFCADHEIQYEALLAGLREGLVYFGSTSGPEALWEPGSRAEFWAHVEAATGLPVPERERDAMQFRCAC